MHPRLKLNPLTLINLSVLIISSLSIHPSTHAQVVLTTSTAVNVRSSPSPNSQKVAELAAGEKVTLESPRGRGTYNRGRNKFFKVTYGNNQTGWVHGDYLLVPDIENRTTETGEEIAMTPEEFAAAAEAMPLCGTAAHYRWLEKTTTSGFTQQSSQASVNAVLNWNPLPFKGKSISSWCTDRVGREARAFSVLGFVRRIRKETDGDVHIEITQNATDPVENCAVVEIPAANLSSKFNTARNNLASLLSVTQLNNKDFTTPTRVRFFGLAFWDGWHATDDLPVSHGRCNSTTGAAWELHPVFKVAAP